MSEDKQITTEEKQEEKKSGGSAAKVKVAKKTEKKDLTTEVEDSNPLGLEELPEEIKKKLEKKKSEKSGKFKTKIVKKKKKAPKRVTTGKAFIKATYNNTIVTLTDLQGNVLSWASAGVAGFKGPKKSTPYAAQIIARIAVGKAREQYGLSDVSVYVSGVGSGRESAIRALNSNGLNVGLIKDTTSVPHNGCRKRKPRRV